MEARLDTRPPPTAGEGFSILSKLGFSIPEQSRTYGHFVRNEPGLAALRNEIESSNAPLDRKKSEALREIEELLRKKFTGDSYAIQQWLEEIDRTNAELGYTPKELLLSGRLPNIRAVLDHLKKLVG